MKYTISFMLCLIIISAFISCDNDVTSSDGEDNDSTRIIVYKPNIYIYPTEGTNLSVTISFPNSGYIMGSIPEYNKGWNVTVTPEGIINGVYTYLFYEYNVPDFYQKEYGWVVAKDKLSDFFTKNMKACGFSPNEIQDFTDYWIPILTDYRYYKIYPQYNNTVDKMTIINFSEEPENLYRLHYYISGTNTNDNSLLNPPILTAKRQGYFAVEWVVVLE